MKNNQTDHLTPTQKVEAEKEFVKYRKGTHTIIDLSGMKDQLTKLCDRLENICKALEKKEAEENKVNDSNACQS